MRFVVFLMFLLPAAAYGQQQIRPLVEPYIGLTRGEFDFGSSALANAAQGRVYGIRGLIGFYGVFVGGDHSAGLVAVNYTTPGESDEEYDFTDTGWYLGYHFGFGLRLWYVGFTSHKAINQNGDQIDGSGGAKYGIGYIVREYISLNVELVSRLYDDSSLSGAVDYSFSSWTASIGFPFP